MGNNALAFGLLTASQRSGFDLYYGGYPITPASDILHYLAQYKHFGVKTFQAEDEIAGITSVILIEEHCLTHGRLEGHVANQKITEQFSLKNWYKRS